MRTKKKAFKNKYEETPVESVAVEQKNDVPASAPALERPKYPTVVDDGGRAYANKDQDGMNMRQFYAAHAPITWNDALDYAMSRTYPENPTHEQVIRNLAQMRFAYADQMVALQRKAVQS